MNVLILAAGYATRLYPLTLNKAKPLLVVGGKPIIEWLVDNLAGIPDLETIYVVTNDKFAADFQAWSQSYQKRHPEFNSRLLMTVPRAMTTSWAQLETSILSSRMRTFPRPAC
jgi:choline kinase